MTTLKCTCSVAGYGFIDFLSSEYAQSALKHIQQNYPQFTIKFAKVAALNRSLLAAAAALFFGAGWSNSRLPVATVTNDAV
ncbi:hypothetical protein Ciccas_003160 [Cichlidogyrus casuarinus]|uniref:RRM domain-containing protein n=1 Tax=Cichlidogyrus casuarinus TaxID=1844966 RepID=A0ABD2QF63_9PLAT